jgi:hypothetical protein
MEGVMLKEPYRKAFPLVRWAITLFGRFAVWFNHLKVRINWKKCLDSWSQMKLSPALAGLDECDKLFVFSEGDMLTPYKRFAQIYENAPGPKQKMLTGGSHSTPLEAEIMRFEWVGWVVSKLTA